MKRLDRLLYLLGRDTKRDPEYNPMGKSEAMALMGEQLKSASRNPNGTVEQREDRRKYAGDSVLESSRIIWRRVIPKTKRDFIRALASAIDDFTEYGEGHDVLLPGEYSLLENDLPEDRDLTRIDLVGGEHPYRHNDGSDMGSWLLCIEAYRDE